MITWLIQQCRLLYKFITSNDSARQMAVAAAFGVVLGLVPKGNLLAIAVTSVFLGLRVHLATGAVVALTFTFMSGMLDPFFHNIGQAILTSPLLQATLTRLYELPFAPWTAFNNTIVCGSLVVGLTAFYPTYRLTLPLFERWHQWRNNGKEEAIELAEDAEEGHLTDGSGSNTAAEAAPLEQAETVGQNGGDSTRFDLATAGLKPPRKPTPRPELATPADLVPSPRDQELAREPATAELVAELRIDLAHNPTVLPDDTGADSTVPRRQPRRPHYLPRTIHTGTDDAQSSVRETLQRRRFRQFVAEVESISRRVA